MNPIENLWDKLKRRIRGRDRASETLGQFRNAIRKERENIPHHMVVIQI